MILLLLMARVMTISTQQKLLIHLSSTDINRLALTNGRIAQIFGADVFHMEIDEKNGQAFLRLKEDVKEQFLGPDMEELNQSSISFVTEDGTTQDLQVNFYKGVSRPCLFQLPEEKCLSRRRQAMNFFHEVLTGKCDDYVTKTTGYPIKRDGLQIVFQKCLVSPLFEASFYQVCCCSRKPWRIRHQHFKESGVDGIYLSTTQITQCQPATLVILRRRV